MDIDYLRNIFPLPLPNEPEDLKLCRDEYIRNIFAPYEDEFKRKLQKKAKNEKVNETENQEKVQVEESIFEKFRNDLGRPIQALDFIFLTFEQSEKDKLENKKYRLTMNKFDEIDSVTSELFDTAIKTAAFKYALYQIIEKLMIISSIGKKKQIVVPYKLFSWSLADLKARTETENTIHFDIMQFELDEDALNRIKFNVDVREVIQLFHLINDAIDDDDFTKITEVLNDCQLAPNSLKESHAEDRNEYDRLVELYFAAKSGKIEARSTIGLNSKLKLENLQDYVDVIDPIKNRYRYNWCKTSSYQLFLKNHMLISDLEKNIVKVRKAKADADFVSDCTLTHLNMQIIKYRDGYNDLLTKFDDDLESAANDVEIARLKTQKAMEDLVFYKEQVVMFHRRIIEVNAAIAEEEAQRQWLLEHPPEKFKKKKRKGKGKAKGDGKEKRKKK